MIEFTAQIDCALSCDVPEGVVLAEVHQPRHSWGDVIHCPNEGCGRSFLVIPVGDENG